MARRVAHVWIRRVTELSYLAAVRESYDTVAAHYADRVRTPAELDPLSRSMPAALAELVHIYPALRFAVGSMTALEIGNDELGDVLARQEDDRELLGPQTITAPGSARGNWSNHGARDTKSARTEVSSPTAPCVACRGLIRR